MAHPDLARRLRSAVEASNLPRAEIAEKADMPRQVLTNMLAGNVPGHRHVPNLARVLHVPLDWLLTGQTAALEDRVQSYAARVSAAAAGGKGLTAKDRVERDSYWRFGLVNSKDATPEVREYATGLAEAVPSALSFSINFERQLALVDALTLALEHYAAHPDNASDRHIGTLRWLRELILEHHFGDQMGEGDENRSTAKLREMLAMIDAAQVAFERGANAAVSKPQAEVSKQARHTTKKGCVARKK